MRKPLVFAVFLLGACRQTHVQPTSVSLDPPRAKLGAAVALRVNQAPPSWSGEIRVRDAVVRVDSKNPGFQLTAINGFTESGNTDLYVTMVDNKGYEVPLANRGRLLLEVVPSSVTIAPLSDEASPAGGSAEIRISAADDVHWSVTGVPPWVQLISAAEGSGNAVLEYKTSANTARVDRTARIAVGDAVFELRQPASEAAGFSPFRTADDTSGKKRPGNQQASQPDSSARPK